MEMTEQDALSRMVPPWKKRPSAPWLGGTIQVDVTNACCEACPGCTRGSQYTGKPRMMSLEQFECAMQSLEGYWGVVGVMGGNPSLHPQFPELCEILCRYFPMEQRAVFSNHPHGHGKLMSRVFNPLYSNCNVHGSQEAYDEFARDWPDIVQAGRQCGIDRLFGLHKDSRHAPVFVALTDVLVEADAVATPQGMVAGTATDNPLSVAERRHLTEGERWTLKSGCEINLHWSAGLADVPGRGLRAFFCEVQYSLIANLKEPESFPDIGIAPFPGWWRLPMTAFAEQARLGCDLCGVPWRGHGALSQSDGPDQVSETYAHLKNKRRRPLELVTERAQMGAPHNVVDYRGAGGGW